MVEPWFSELAQKRIRRRTFRDVRELVKAIKEFVTAYYTDPCPFVWMVKPDGILRKVAINRQLSVSAH